MNQTNTPERTVYQTVFRILLGAFLAFAGTGHLTWHRTEFLAQVPTWLPINADLVVLLSGAVEISLGLSLILLRSKQVQVGWIVALFFVLIFPGNISQYMNGISAFGLDTDRARLIRLFFQPLLVFWAIWSCGSFADLKSKKKS